MQLVQHFKQYYTKVMDLPGAPQKIAYGVALGTALDFLPIPIISIPVGYVLARLLRVNAPATVLAVIFFKWAVPFFFALNYMVGRLLLGDYPPPQIPELTEGLSAWLYKLQHLGYPFLVGAGINSLLAGTASYFLVRRLLELRLRRRIIRKGRKVQRKDITYRGLLDNNDEKNENPKGRRDTFKNRVKKILNTMGNKHAGKKHIKK